MVKFLLLIIFLIFAYMWIRVEPWEVIIAESASEGYKGMYAVACVIRNRKGDLNGFSGGRRKDLNKFCREQPANIIRNAKKAWRIVHYEKGEDITGGATLFENINRYGRPNWDWEKAQRTVKIGNHTFFKELKRRKK